MNDERLDRLIDAHLSGEMTEAERRELEERLLHSAADRARFWELAETHTLLHEAMQRQLAGRAALAETPSRASLLFAWWRRVPRFAIAIPALALAAAVGFVILFSMWLPGGLRPTIASTQGEVQILRDGQLIPANTGGQIRPGERIRTGPNASAELRLADGTSLRMDGSTDVGFLRGRAARQVEVKTGMVHCDVAKQPPGRPLVFQTQHAELTVLGTEFDLLAAPVESRARVHQGRVRWTDGGPGVEVAAGEACTADLQGVQAWVPVCNLDFTRAQTLPRQLETVFCDTESLHTPQRRMVAAPNGIRLEDRGLRFADLLPTFGEHGLLVTRWTEPVGGDVAIEVDVSAVGNWSLGMAVDGDSFEGYRVIFVAPKYPHGIAVDSIHPVEATLLAQDPRPIPAEENLTLRVEKRGQQLRVWVDRELRIDTALAYPLAPDRKQTFALSEFGTGPLIRSLRVWRGGRG